MSNSALHEVAVFGGGCFWCTEAVFRRLIGVISVTSGYAGGRSPNPTYFKVSEGLTDHAEVIQVEFDPEHITFDQLLEVFWATHDPTSLNQQGTDKGRQYRSVIFTTSQAQQNAAEKSRDQLNLSGKFTKPIVTDIQTLDTFYPAEEYHQRFYEVHREQPYCQVVIDPKIEKLSQQFAHLLKPHSSSY